MRDVDEDVLVVRRQRHMNYIMKHPLHRANRPAQPPYLVTDDLLGPNKKVFKCPVCGNQILRRKFGKHIQRCERRPLPLKIDNTGE